MRWLVGKCSSKLTSETAAYGSKSETVWLGQKLASKHYTPVLVLRVFVLTCASLEDARWPVNELGATDG